MAEKIWRVRWEIDVCADSPKEAALRVLAYHRNYSSTAVVFEVRPFEDETAVFAVVDLTSDSADAEDRVTIEEFP